MILREHVVIVFNEFDTFNTYAELIPLRTDETFELNLSTSKAHYRIVLPPLDPSRTPSPNDTISWRGREYRLVGPALDFTVNGSIHHLEGFVESV